MKTLRRLGTKFEDAMSAIAFAETGEFETAKKMMKKDDDLGDSPRRKMSNSIRPKMVAKEATR
jgi:hypothetical protein